MKQSILGLSEFVGDYTRKLADGIAEEQMAAQPAPGLNTPAWVLGHLAMAYDYGTHLLGGTHCAPPGWGKIFGPGSSPVPPAGCPNKADLLAGCEAARKGLCAALASATEAKLAEPNPFGPMKPFAPAMGDFIAHLLTTHAVSHLGQLSAWRRLQGLPAVLGF